MKLSVSIVLLCTIASASAAGKKKKKTKSPSAPAGMTKSRTMSKRGSKLAKYAKKGNQDLQLAWNAAIVRLWDNGFIKSLHDAVGIILYDSQDCVKSPDAWPFPDELHKKGSLMRIIENEEIVIGFPGNYNGMGEPYDCSNYRCAGRGDSVMGKFIPGSESGIVPETTAAAVQKLSEYYFNGEPDRISIKRVYISDSRESFNILQSGQIDLLDGFFGGGIAERDVYFTKMCNHLNLANTDVVTTSTLESYPNFLALKKGVSDGDLTVGAYGGSRDYCDALYDTTIIDDNYYLDLNEMLEDLKNGDFDIACSSEFPVEDPDIQYVIQTTDDGAPLLAGPHYFGRRDSK